MPAIMAAILVHPEVLADYQALGELSWEQGPEAADRLRHIFETAPALREQVQAIMARPETVESVSEGFPEAMAPLAKAVMTNATCSDAFLSLMTDREFMADAVRANKTGSKDLGFLPFQRSEVLKEQWNIFMEPMVSWVRNVGIISNVVLIAFICLLTSLKSSDLSMSKIDSKKKADLEKVMRRDITVDELKRHAVPGDMWMAVDGMVCDITDFLTVHPGGADLLLEHAGTDATEQFKEVGHSEFAGELVKARLVGVLMEGEAGGGAAQGEDGGSAGVFGGLKSRAKRVLPAQLFALFTREDPYNFHKIVGVTVIVHFLIRWYFAVSGAWLLGGRLRDPMLFDGSWFSLGSVWFCLLLQISSFQFVLPRNRVLGRPMLWQEWRAHNLIFTLRSLAAFTVCWVRTHYEINTMSGQVALTIVCCLAVFGQLYFADVASRQLRDSKHESLTASWPLWEGCPPMVEWFLKFYYSIGINQLTSMSLSSGMTDQNMMPTFAGIVILQTDSFAMTLVRKNIIQTATFHGYYLWNMIALALLIQHTHGRMTYVFSSQKSWWLHMNLTLWGTPVMVYIVRYLGLSKYGCWAGYMAKILVEQTTDYDYWAWMACPVVWAAWAVGQLLLSGYVFEYRVRRFLEGGRPKPVVLRSRERVTKSLYRLCFDMPAGYACGMMPGQHMRVLAPNISKNAATWNGQENLEKGAANLSRSYTPICSPDSTSLEILVKHYPRDADAGFPEGGRASTYLIEELKVGGEVLASGPHGQRIYLGNGLFEVQVGRPKLRPRLVAVLAGGSGVTPALSVLREVQAEARRKSNKHEAWRYMDYENEVSVTDFHVLHVNRTPDDGLPLSFYEDSSQAQQLVPVHVTNLATRSKVENEGEPLDNRQQDPPRLAVRSGELDAKAVREAFPAPAADLLVILCGPHNFIVNVCQPLLKQMGYEHVIPMW